MNFNEYMSSSNEEKFEYLMGQRSNTNRTRRFWFNWGNVTKSITTFLIKFNTLNYMLFKQHIVGVAKSLFI